MLKMKTTVGEIEGSENNYAIFEVTVEYLRQGSGDKHDKSKTWCEILDMMFGQLLKKLIIHLKWFKYYSFWS